MMHDCYQCLNIFFINCYAHAKNTQLRICVNSSAVIEVLVSLKLDRACLSQLFSYPSNALSFGFAPADFSCNPEAILSLGFPMRNNSMSLGFLGDCIK